MLRIINDKKCENLDVRVATFSNDSKLYYTKEELKKWKLIINKKESLKKDKQAKVVLDTIKEIRKETLPHQKRIKELQDSFKQECKRVREKRFK